MAKVEFMDENKYSDVEKFTVDYLEEKYGEKFTVSTTYGGGCCGSYDYEMYVSCDSLPGKEIHVYADNLKESDQVISDNYLMYKHEDEILEYIKKQVAKEFEHTVIYWHIVDMTLAPALPADATLEQILKDPGANLNVKIDVLEGELTDMEQVQRAMEDIKANVADYEFLFVSVEKENFGKLRPGELISRYNDNDIVAGATSYCINGHYREVWRDSKE